MIKLIALFGKSASGKSTVQKELIKNKNFHRVVSCTSRPKRKGEVDGKDYHFYLPTQFIEGVMQHDFIEVCEFNDWFYGTRKQDLKRDKVNIGVFTPTGIEALFDTADCYELEVYPVYIECSDKERMRRSLEREPDPSVREICRRFMADEEDFANINFDFIAIDGSKPIPEIVDEITHSGPFWLNH